MECRIFRRGIAVGTMTVEEDGLYRIVHARIPLQSVPVRLYAPQKLGVFVPEGEWMVLRKRISRRLMPNMPEYAAALTQSDRTWSDETDGLRLRYTPEGIERAVRLQMASPMVFPAAPELLRLIMIGAVPYLCCTQGYLI